MKKKTALLCISLLILLMISWTAPAQTPPPELAKELARTYSPSPKPKGTMITTSSFEGQEIQKVIDYLRANVCNKTADNIQKFLDAGKIRVADLGAGVNGESDLKGNIFVDDGKFPFSPKSGGFNPDNPVHVGWMMSLASVLAHEKYHAENHGWWERIAGNGKHKLGGDNDMEIEAWAVELNLLDDHIIQLLDRYIEGTNLTTKEKLWLLKTINAIYNEKIPLVDGFNDPDDNPKTDDSYGKGIWDASRLERFREHIRRLIKEEDVTRKLEEVQQHSDDLKEFELDTDMRLAAAMEGFDEGWPQEYAFKTASIAATIAGLSPEDSFTTDLVLILDLPSDISDEAVELLLDYDGETQEVTVSPTEEGAIIDAHYTMIIAESTVAQIIAQEDPAAKARELYANGVFLIATGIEDVQIEPWAFSLEMELRQSVDWYNENIETTPVAKLIKLVFGNERLNIVFTKGEESATYTVIIREGIIEDFARGGLDNPTMGVVMDYDTIDYIKASPDPAEAVVQAFYRNRIKYSVPKGKADPRGILTKGLVRLIDVLRRSPYDIRAGQEKDIDYHGQAARLVANPNDVKVVVIEGLHDQPVVDKAGMTLGYTNDFTQNIIKTYPQTFSPNAGVYLSPGIDAPATLKTIRYAEYWESGPHEMGVRLSEVSTPVEAVYVGLSGARYT